MSVANHEIEEQDEWEGFCQTHAQYYLHAYRCAGCANDEADQQFEMRRERTLEIRAQRREKGRAHERADK